MQSADVDLGRSGSYLYILLSLCHVRPNPFIRSIALMISVPPSLDPVRKVDDSHRTLVVTNKLFRGLLLSSFNSFRALLSYCRVLSLFARIVTLIVWSVYHVQTATTRTPI